MAHNCYCCCEIVAEDISQIQEQFTATIVEIHTVAQHISQKQPPETLNNQRLEGIAKALISARNNAHSSHQNTEGHFW